MISYSRPEWTTHLHVPVTRKARAAVLATALALGVGVPAANAAMADPALAIREANGVVFVNAQHFSSDVTVAVEATILNGSGSTTVESDDQGHFVVAFRPPAEYNGEVVVSANANTDSARGSIAVRASGTTTTSSLTSSSVTAPTAAATATTAPPTASTSTRTGGTAASTAPELQATVVTPRTAPLASIGGQSAPGAPAGWTPVFSEDFSTGVALGSWPGPYASKFDSYNGFHDTSGAGTYSNSILSVHDGVLDMYLHTENGTPLVAAPVPKLNSNAYEGQTYGRYSVRFRSDSLPGFKTAWLLWPDTDKWTSEIDFPEGNLGETMSAFNHCPWNASQNCSAFDTGVSYTGWHIATTEWTPGLVTFLLDGKVVGTDTKAPSESMHWVLQTETDGGAPSPNVAGHLQIDWVAAYSRS